jgi:hypothetical protein
MWVFCRAGRDRWTRGLPGENLDAIGLRPVHIEVDSSGLLPIQMGRCPRLRGGGVMSRADSVAPDPSVGV